MTDAAHKSVVRNLKKKTVFYRWTSEIVIVTMILILKRAGLFLYLKFCIIHEPIRDKWFIKYMVNSQFQPTYLHFTQSTKIKNIFIDGRQKYQVQEVLQFNSLMDVDHF